MSTLRCVQVLVAIFTAELFLSSPLYGQPMSRDIEAAAVRAAMEQAFLAAPRGLAALQAPSQAGMRVLDVRVQRISPTAQRLTIDLSQKTLTYDPSGDVAAVLDHILQSTARATAGAGHVEYRFLIDGLSLDQFVARAPAGRIQPNAIDSAGRVVVSAGHGWYVNAASGRWELQRDYYWGIVEDLVNWDIASHLTGLLRASGLDA